MRGLGRWIAGSASGFGVCLVLFSLSRSLWLSALILVPSGFFMMMEMAASNTLIQAMVPDRLRGRVMAVYSMMFMGMAPLGALMAGSLAANRRPRNGRDRGRRVHRRRRRLQAEPAHLARPCARAACDAADDRRRAPLVGRGFSLAILSRRLVGRGFGPAFLYHPSMLTRRGFVVTSGAWLACTALGVGREQSPPTRLVMLGTAGGPTPKAKSAAPAQAIVVGDRIYIVDCGDGVARQLALAGLSITQVRAVFITHQHSDHNAGYGPLLLLAWASNLMTPVDAYGPPPLVEMTERLLQAYRFDIELRMKDEGRPALAPLVRPHEFTTGGEIFRDDRVRVTAALNEHVPIQHSFAYRFDTGGRSIVFSGDTRYSDNVVKLARGADVLVHEVLSRTFWERPGAPQPPDVVRHILASHTDAADVGRVATNAGVGTLVLTHYVPTEGKDAPTDDQWIAAVRQTFKGRIVLGKDLLEI